MSGRPAGAAGEALVALLYQLGDDELIVGHRNSEWTGLGPLIEEDIAFSSMAQDELGHAQAYYRLLADLGEGDPNELAFARDPGEFRNAQLVELPRTDYAFSLLRQLLYDAGEQVRLQALLASSYKPLADLARKLRNEERYHLLHGRTWVRQLGLGNEESNRRMQAALDELFPYALGLFEPAPWDQDMQTAGIQVSERALQQQWLDLVCPLLNESGLRVPAEEGRSGWQLQAGVVPCFGGRRGQHTPHLAALLADMQSVYRAHPGATW